MNDYRGSLPAQSGVNSDLWNRLKERGPKCPPRIWKRRGSYALLTRPIAAFGLAILGAGSASPCPPWKTPVSSTSALSCVKQGEAHRSSRTTTIDPGVSGADGPVIWINSRKEPTSPSESPARRPSTVNAGDTVSIYVEPGYFVAGQRSRSVRGPPEPTPDPVGHPQPADGRRHHPGVPVVFAVPGTTRTVIVSPGAGGEEGRPRRQPAATASPTTDPGPSWSWVCCCRRGAQIPPSHTGRRH